jgi:hypothetical protein
VRLNGPRSLRRSVGVPAGSEAPACRAILIAHVHDGSHQTGGGCHPRTVRRAIREMDSLAGEDITTSRALPITYPARYSKRVSLYLADSL